MKKIPTLYQRDFTRDNGRYVTDEVTPGCEWVFDGVGVATRKFDGTCVMVDDDGRLWARREVKRGKPTPPGFVPIETDDTTGKTVGWEPAEQSSFAKILAEFKHRPGTVGYPPGTYELVGPKVNGNPEGYSVHALVTHGNFVVHHLGGWTRTDIVMWLRDNPGYEGLVFWERPGDMSGRLAKIKRRDLPEFSGAVVAEHAGPHPCKAPDDDSEATA